MMTLDQINVVLAASAVILTLLTVAIAGKTLDYMRNRDLELDTRNGWIEIHKAMTNLRVQRELIMLPGQMAALGVQSPTTPSIADYTLASEQLVAQLDRLNEDPTVTELSAFLNKNRETKSWQTDEFVTKFDQFKTKVALKARPA
jgi:hypothetical protein